MNADVGAKINIHCTGTHLYKILVAPLRREVDIIVRPAIVAVEQGDVVPHIAAMEGIVSIVGLDPFVLGSVEDCIAYRCHGADGGQLF